MRRLAGYLFIAFCTIFVDQSVKLYLTIGEQDIVSNQGIGFGLFGESEVIGFILNLLGIVGVAYWLVRFLKSESSKFKNIYLVLLSTILGAGLSNMLDRIFRGGVMDYIKFWFLPKFNIADLLITASVTILLILFLSEALNERKEKRI